MAAIKTDNDKVRDASKQQTPVEISHQVFRQSALRREALLSSSQKCAQHRSLFVTNTFTEGEWELSEPAT